MHDAKRADVDAAILTASIGKPTGVPEVEPVDASVRFPGSQISAHALQPIAQLRQHAIDWQSAMTVLTLSDIAADDAQRLLDAHGLRLCRVLDDEPIPGSYWGEPEAGVIGNAVYARGDTPVHSLLHEACHLIVLAPERRAAVHTDASDSIEEEDATCYLQIVLADALPGVGRARLMRDMDAWGYSFRLGSTRAWFERDAEDARTWLASRGLLPAEQPAP